jgi:predicted N-formylglutamate amidohydrolase
VTELPDSLFSNQSAPIVENATGKGDVVLICEHAGRLLPESLGSLGIDAEAMSAHIAWDIGAAGLAHALSKQLDAPLILQRYSRLVFDCNRVFDAVDAIVSESDSVVIPQNCNLSHKDRLERYDLVYTPFENAIGQVIDDCARQGRQPAIICIHSFTPIFNGQQRSLDLGVVHDGGDARLADCFLDLAKKGREFSVARNQPYAPRDGVTHTLVKHGVQRNLLNVMFEVRNDLILDDDGQQQWAQHLGALITEALTLHSENTNASNI